MDLQVFSGVHRTGEGEEKKTKTPLASQRRASPSASLPPVCRAARATAPPQPWPPPPAKRRGGPWPRTSSHEARMRGGGGGSALEAKGAADFAVKRGLISTNMHRSCSSALEFGHSPKPRVYL